MVVSTTPESPIKECQKLAHSLLGPQIRSICFPTANRVHMLIKSATTYIQNAKYFDHKVKLVVADGSLSPEVRDQYKEALKRLSIQFDIPVYYAGLEEKIKYAATLANESKVPMKTIEFAILDPFDLKYCPGSNRNTLLFHNAGETFLSADDDTSCEVVVPDPERESLNVTGEFDPTRVWPYASLDAIKKSVRFEQIDFLKLHERFLGNDLGSIAKSFSNSEIHLDESVSDFTEKVRGNNLKVLVSLTGIAGDSGFKSQSFLLLLPDPAFTELVKSETSYRAMFDSRQIVRRPDTYTINGGGFCQSTALALDNRDFLPPFLPVLRAEDFIFSMLLPAIFPDAAMAYLPQCILHTPQDNRNEKKSDRLAFKTPLAPLFRALLHSASLSSSGEGENKLISLAQNMRHSVNSETFPFLAAVSARSVSQSMLSQFEGLLAHRKLAPEYWAADMKRLINTFKSDLEMDEYIPPAGLILSHGKEEAFATFVEILLTYFDLLEAWPKLNAAAKRLKKDQGIFLGKLL